MAFLNVKLDNFWKDLLKKIKYTDQVEMLEDLYELAPEKLAYWDFTFFVNQYLVQEDFYETLKEQNRHARKQDVRSDTLAHNFTYEFMVIEIFCFHEEIENESARDGGWGHCQLI